MFTVGSFHHVHVQFYDQKFKKTLRFSQQAAVCTALPLNSDVLYEEKLVRSFLDSSFLIQLSLILKFKRTVSTVIKICFSFFS